MYMTLRLSTRAMHNALPLHGIIFEEQVCRKKQEILHGDI
jgi:hypothetical protein